MTTTKTNPRTKERICRMLDMQLGFWRQEVTAIEQYLADLIKTDEATVLLADRHNTNQAEIEGDTTTIRDLAAQRGMDLDTLRALFNQPDDDGFEDWLDVPFMHAAHHAGAIHIRQVNTDEGYADNCYAHDGKFYRYNGRFELSKETWYVNTIDPHHEVDVWTTGF